MSSQKKFGGAWSGKKLQALQKYLTAYTTALSKTRFTKIYIDAFAGAGLEKLSREEQEYRHGSPLIALANEPAFDQFVFIDKSQDNLDRLRNQIKEEPRPIDYLCADANTALTMLCQKTNWKSHRAVAFLDPFALQVRWETIRLIAATKAIDMWLLFPAMAVNRMLTRSGEIESEWQKKLNVTFGSDDWKEVFYSKESPDLFGHERIIKNPNPFDVLSTLVTAQLKKEFHSVHEEPLILKNSGNAPLFLLCFAAGHHRGGPIAIKIANHIIQTSQ